MSKLIQEDLSRALVALPRALIATMEDSEWHDKVFVAGGFLRSIVAGEPINDIDIFLSNKNDIEQFLVALRSNAGNPTEWLLWETENAITLKAFTPNIQIITRYDFGSPSAVINNFDFTCCCAAVYFGGAGEGWNSICDERFYPDLAARRLVYRFPDRKETGGGTAVRVVKLAQRGYHVPLSTYAGVLACLFKRLDIHHPGEFETPQLANIILKALHDVAPATKLLAAPTEITKQFDSSGGRW